jgi:hypothetical protein
MRVTKTDLILFTFFLFIGNSFLFSQEEEVELVKKDTVAYSLEKANKSPLDIKVLDLSKQKLKELPNEFYELTNLEVLILDKNKLKSLPRSIASCKNLRKISIASNKFTEFPSIICYLSQLQLLDFSTNEIAELPDCLKELIHLEAIYMVGNEVGKIPSSLNHLNLKEIDMRMIQMNEKEQYTIRDQFPNAEIKFSKPCNCFEEEEESDDTDDDDF